MQHLLSLLLAIWVSAVFSLSSQAAVVTAHFTSAATIPVTAATYTATGNTVNLSLGYAPTTGTNLTVVRNTGLPFINGTFSNLAHGQEVNLTFGGVNYEFVANYYGGTGNDLVLQWARIAVAAWGSGGQLGDDLYATSATPVSVTTSGVLADKTVVSVVAGGG